MFEHGRPLMEFIQETGMPVPKILAIAAQPALNAALRKAFTQEEIDVDALQRIVDQIKKWQVQIEFPETEYFLRVHMQGLTRQLARDPSDLQLMGKIDKLMELLKSIPIEIVLWQVQNDYYVLAKTVYPEYLARQRQGEEGAAIWLEAFRKLGERFRFNLDAVLPQQ